MANAVVTDNAAAVTDTVSQEELKQLHVTNNKVQQWMAAAVKRQQNTDVKMERLTAELEDKHQRETTVADATFTDKAAQVDLEQLCTANTYAKY